MIKRENDKRKVHLALLMLITLLLSISSNFWMDAYAQDTLTDKMPTGPALVDIPNIEVINPYFTIEHIALPDGTALDKNIINGPPNPPTNYETERTASLLPMPSEGTLTDFPSYDWVFGCSAVSGAMIAAYYDRNGYPNIYTGPADSGVMPITDTSWSLWWDGYNLYPNNPLVASHIDVDGRVTRGSIDDYWVRYGSTASDPYITGGWTQHTWGNAIGDYMKTSQSAYGNTDGSTSFYTYESSSSKLTCTTMEDASIANRDGTYGRKLFYEARGYAVTDCYSQKTDNTIIGGFSLADYKSEIDAGHPVFLNLAGHSIVGYGYGSGSTIYIRDTWDSNPNNTFTMTWGGSYQGLQLLSVSIVNLQTPTLKNYLLTANKDGDGSGTVTSDPAGIDCGTTCNALFEDGTNVTLTAAPADGSTFIGWNGDCSGTGTNCNVSMTQAREVTAAFSLTDPSDGWIISGSMNYFRTGHSLVLLSDGKVLVAGGKTDTGTYLKNTELYEPASGTWTETGQLNKGRAEHTATFLNNGKVLIAGGSDSTSILASAELFDPETGLWTETGSMNNARYAYTATLLPDGKVLVAGGVGEGLIFLDSAEIYDPITGTWTFTGNLNDSRSTIASTVLPDGKVLIAGGENEVFLTSAEIYDPITGIWTYTGSMNKNHHYNPLVTLNNGKILYAGAPTNSSCELYNPETGVWINTGSMNVLRRHAAFTKRPDGNVLAVGGTSYPSTSAEIYDPDTGTWLPIESMNNAIPGPKAVLLQNGMTLVSGGTYSELYGYPLTVIVEQAAGQVDPTNTSPINFTVTFSDPIDFSTFTSSDVTLKGSAGATTALISETAPHDGTTFNIAVSAMEKDGTVTATIPAGSVQDLFGGYFPASTSTDNEVTYDMISPNVTVEQSIDQTDPAYLSPIHFTATFSESIDLDMFDSSDVILEGTAGASTVVITQVSPNDATTFNIAVSGMSNRGTVTLSIPSGSVKDLAGNSNTASTSTDNEVTYELYTLSVIKAGNGEGIVTSDPIGINCGPACEVDFANNTVITLTATPSTGSTFTGWSGAGCSGTGSCLVTMNESNSVTAAFDRIPSITYTIAASAGANGDITPSGDVIVTEGADQTFVITPADDYKISVIYVDGIPIRPVNHYTFYNATSNHTIHAIFEEIAFDKYLIFIPMINK